MFVEELSLLVNIEISMGTSVQVPNEGRASFVEDAILMLNASTKCIDILNTLVRACKENAGFVSTEVWVLHNVSRNSITFSDDLEKLCDIEWQRKELVVIHRCSVMHIPFIVGSSMYADEVSDVCEFIRDKGGDVNAWAAQSIPGRGGRQHNIKNVFYERKKKTPIFYAIEKKCLQMVKKLIDLGADHNAEMYDAYSTSDTVIPVIYAMSRAIAHYEREDGSFEVIDLLLGKTGVESLIGAMRSDRHARNVGLSFVAMVGLDLEVFPGVLMEAVKGEHINIIEFFLKCTKIFRKELSDIKCTQKYRNMFCGRVSRRKGTSLKSIPMGTLPLSRRFLKYVDSLPCLSGSSFVGKNVIFSADIGNEETQILALAAYYGHAEVVKWLLANETIDVNRANGYGFTAMHFAASMNRAELVEMLLDAGASMESRRMPFTTATHIAALNGAIDVIKCIHNRCPEALFKLDAAGQNILHYAASCANDNTEVVKYIVEHIREIDPSALSDAEQGCEVLTSRACEALAIQKGQDITDEDRVKITEYIKERGTDSSGSSALYIAVESKNLNVARFLIENAKCDPNVMGPKEYTALNLNTDGGTLLHMAVLAKNLDFVKKLLSFENIDLSARYRGRTPLDLAIIARDRAMISLLLEDSRQSLTTEVGYREVPYSKILSSKGLLDYRGRKAILHRVKGDKSKNIIVVASIIFAVSALFIVIVALSLNVILGLAGASYVVSWEQKTLFAVVCILPIITTYVIFGGVQVVKEGERRDREKFQLSTSHVRSINPIRYVSDSGRLSDSLGSAASGSSIVSRSRESVDEYLADDSDLEHCINNGDRRKNISLRKARKRHLRDTEVNRECGCMGNDMSSSNSESSQHPSTNLQCGDSEIVSVISMQYCQGVSSFSR